ncbi:MAG TPA: 30S ribosome-binding factor RbfA [Chloroflexi bacterium]|nr:30S ribosome-binding factor RbfA [Chloroflexota bacterium]
MQTKRQRRVAEQIQEILSELIQFEADDPRLDGVTIMDVEIDRELMYATVYVNALRGEEVREEVMTALSAAQGFLRSELGKRVRLQHTPELRFKWDESLSYADRIDSLLDSLEIPPEDRDTDAPDKSAE